MGCSADETLRIGGLKVVVDMKKSIDGGGCSKDNFPGSVT
jgi:hypothetical protein